VHVAFLPLLHIKMPKVFIDLHHLVIVQTNAVNLLCILQLPVVLSLFCGLLHLWFID